MTHEEKAAWRSSCWSPRRGPGRHITDCQTRLYMKSRQSNVPAIAAAKAAAARPEEEASWASSSRPACRGMGLRDRANAGDRPRHPPVAIFEEICRSAPDLGAPHRRMAGSQRSRPRCDLPPGASAGPHGPVHRPGRAWHHDRERAVRSPALSLPAGILGVRACPVVLGGESFVALAEGL